MVLGKSFIGNRNLSVNALKRVRKVDYYSIDDHIIPNDNLLHCNSIFVHFTGEKLYKILHLSNNEYLSDK